MTAPKRVAAKPAEPVISPECRRRDCARCEHNCHLILPLAGAQAEIAAIGAAHEALRGLDHESLERALRWLSDRLRSDIPRTSRYDEEPPF